MHQESTLRLTAHKGLSGGATFSYQPGHRTCREGPRDARTLTLLRTTRIEEVKVKYICRPWEGERQLLRCGRMWGTKWCRSCELQWAQQGREGDRTVVEELMVFF